MGDLSFIIEFAGRRFASNAIDFEGLDDLSSSDLAEPITVTNQDDIVMTLDTADDGTFSGTLTQDGAELATISDDFIVTFNDGSFVSLQ